MSDFHHYPKVEIPDSSAPPAAHGPRPQPSAPPLPDTESDYTEPATGYPVIGYPPDSNNQHPYAPPPPRPLPPLLFPPPPLPPPRQPFLSCFYSRRALGALIAAVVIISVISVIVNSLFVLRAPVVRVVGMSVSNFPTSGTAWTAHWEVSMTVENHSTRLKGTFERVSCFIYYQNILLSRGYVQPFELGVKEVGNMRVTMTTEGMARPDDIMMSQLDRDWKNGVVVFNLAMGMSVSFRHRPWWTKHQGFQVSCSIIKVGFGLGNSGSMVDGDKSCQVS